MIHLVTYDLRKPGQDYSRLHEQIKTLGACWHYLESTWLVDTDISVAKVSSQLRNYIDKNDHLLVINVNKDYDGWLPQKAWDWLNERRFASATY